MSELRQPEPGVLLGEYVEDLQPQSDFGLGDSWYAPGDSVWLGRYEASGGYQPQGIGVFDEQDAPQFLGGPTDITAEPAGCVQPHTLPVQTGWYGAETAPAPTTPYRVAGEHGRRRWHRIGLAAGAVVVAAAVGVTGIFGSRGHTEAHPGPQPAATVKAHPKWWRPILQGKTINLENAQYDARHDMNAAVMGAKDSTEEIMNYTDVGENGRAEVSTCTAFIGEDAVGAWAFRSAAHCVAGGKYAPFPNYIIEMNSGGTDRQVFVDTFQVPASYDRAIDGHVDAHSDDMTIVKPYTEDWVEADGTGGKAHQNTPNGITSIRPLKNSVGKAAVGSLFFSWGMKSKDGAVGKPPQSPVVQAFVLAGYTDDGNREILIPLDQWKPAQEEGNSGSAVIDDGAHVDSVLIAAGAQPASYIKGLTGLRVIGGKNAPVNQRKITFIVSQANNQNNLEQVQDAPATKPAFPSIVPHIKVPA